MTKESSPMMKTHTGNGSSLRWLRVFGLERIERERRDLLDFEGLTWGGVLPSGGF